MSRDIDGIIKQKFAENGDVGLGGLDLDEGWPISYSTPGGQHPQRLQFNQLFRYLSALGVEINSKGPFLDWDGTDPEGPNYEIGTVVKGTDGKYYKGLIPNGPASTIINPVGDSTGTWTEFFAIKGIQPISASISANAMTIGLKAGSLDFRKTDLTNGEPENIPYSDLSLVIPDGATLGTVNTVESELILIAINNSGTVELAIVSISGGNDLSETGLITTVAIDATADSDDVFYSETARVGVPYRVVGSVRSTQAISGTWATTPSLVQGYGGQALSSMSSLGYGQTWQDVTGSRIEGVTYYNTSGKPIVFNISASSAILDTSQSITVTVNGVAVTVTADNPPSGESARLSGNIVIPPGSSYVYNGTFALTALEITELR